MAFAALGSELNDRCDVLAERTAELQAELDDAKRKSAQLKDLVGRLERDRDLLAAKLRAVPPPAPAELCVSDDDAVFALERLQRHHELSSLRRRMRCASRCWDWRRSW